MKGFLTISLVASLFSVTNAHAENVPHWTYQGEAGPRHWGQLTEDYRACSTGKSQSPINIETSKVTSAVTEPMSISYRPSNAEAINTGHTIQVNLTNAGALTLGGEKYRLVQFHFHTPSEEKIDGKRFPMVMHLVHKSEEGKLAVIAVLLRTGGENLALRPVMVDLPAKAGESHKFDGMLDVNKLLPAKRDYYGFIGSLTTPPCSENVRWLVMKSPLMISSGQLASFKSLYQMNARPVQARNGRTIQSGK